MLHDFIIYLFIYLFIYIQFKQLMNKLDPFDADDNGSDQDVPTGTSTSNATLQPQKVCKQDKLLPFPNASPTMIFCV